MRAASETTPAPGMPDTVNTMKGEASFTVTLLTAGLAPRSSLSAAGAPFVPGASGVPVVFVALNRLPVPLSRIVPVAGAEAVPCVLAAASVNDCEFSYAASLTIAVRTRSVVPVAGIWTYAPGV